jgi:hypothetical protein
MSFLTNSILLLIVSSFALTEACAKDAGGENQMTKPLNTEQHPYVGMWVTKDGYIRHDLLPNGRYDEARGTTQSA